MADFSRNIREATKVAERYEASFPQQRGYKRINLVMDITAADGVNGNRPLDYDRWLAADNFNFMHDLSGICRHIDRETGEIGGFFVPRFTKKLVAA